MCYFNILKVLIDGDLPNNCPECRFFDPRQNWIADNLGEIHYTDFKFCELCEKDIISDSKPSWCPLIKEIK